MQEVAQMFLLAVFFCVLILGMENGVLPELPDYTESESEDLFE